MLNDGRPARIYIADTHVDDRVVQSKQGGGEFRIRSQTGYLHGANPMGLAEIQVNLQDGAPPYRPGVYEISARSFEVKGNFGRLDLAFGGIKLLPVRDDDPAGIDCLRMVDALRGGSQPPVAQPGSDPDIGDGTDEARGKRK